MSKLPLVIGLCGYPGAGKDTAYELLVAHGFKVYGLSDRLRETSKDRGVPLPSRVQLQDLGDELRAKQGNGVLAILTAQKIIAEKTTHAVINGLRNPEEAEYLKQCRGLQFVLIAIAVPAELRFARMQGRNRSGDPTTWEAFLQMDAREKGTAAAATSLRVGQVMEMADVEVDNSGSAAELEERLSAALTRLGLAQLGA